MVTQPLPPLPVVAGCYGPVDVRAIHEMVDTLLEKRAHGSPQERHLALPEDIARDAVEAVALGRHLFEILAGWAVRHGLGRRLLNGRDPVSPTEPDTLGDDMLSGPLDGDRAARFTVEEKRAAMADVLRHCAPAPLSAVAHELGKGLDDLNWGSAAALLSPSAVKRKGDARELNRWRLFALQCVEFERGRGQKKRHALAAVAAAIHGSVEKIEKWRKTSLPRDLGKDHLTHQLAAARRAGELIAAGIDQGPSISAKLTSRMTPAADQAALAFLAMYGAAICQPGDGLLRLLRAGMASAESHESRRTKEPALSIH